MNENEQSHHSHQEQESDSVHHDHRPYWKRAHRDWVLGRSGVDDYGHDVYVMSEDLSVRFRSRPPVTLGK